MKTIEKVQATANRQKILSPNARGGYSLLGMIIIVIIVVALGGIVVDKIFKSTTKAGKKANEQSGLSAINAFVKNGADGSQEAADRYANSKGLGLAVKDGDLVLVHAYLKEDVNVNFRYASSSNATLLHRAARDGNIEIARLLIEHGAEINSVNDNALTPLHFATMWKDCDQTMAKLLLEEGADYHAKDDQGRTPLHMAASNGKFDTVQLLIDYGADINAKTENGDRPLALAMKALNEAENEAEIEKQDHIVYLLREKGAKR